jgi:hypothetical protein
MRSWMFQHSRDYLSLRTMTKMINSLLMLSFLRDQYQNRLLNKKMRDPFSHIQRCSDQSWWKIDWDDFWISALSSHVHLLNVSLINILLFDTRNISSSENKISDDSDWSEMKSSYDSVCQWRMSRTSQWNLLNWLYDRWLLTISDHWSDLLVNHWAWSRRIDTRRRSDKH